MPNKYYIDTETQSLLDLRKVGAMKYLHTPKSDIVCMSWQRDEEPIRLWVPGLPPPFSVGENDRVYAFNATFDWRVWNILGYKYLFPPIPLENMIDVQALCSRYTYPQQLDEAAKILKVQTQKDPRGKSLMKKICSPPFKFTQEELKAFYAYCLKDTKAMRQVLAALPSDTLSDEEQAIWECTVRINNRGIPVDLPLVKRIWAVINYYKEKRLKEVPVITNGEVKTIGQIQAIKDFCNARGCGFLDLRSETVSEFLEDCGWADPACVQLLELRQELGRSSLAKYQKILELAFNDVVYDNLRYHVASTGRWAGGGIQLHNLPREKVKNVEETIAQFYDYSILKHDPMRAAKALIRSCIKAPDGYKFAILDFKSIENRGVAWVAGENRILELHRRGLDEYKDFGKDLFNTTYDEIEGERRLVSKVVVLGAGYNLGAGGLLGYAEGYGLNLTDTQAKEAINKYRETHPKVVKLWYGLKDAAVNAILHPGVETFYRDCSFKVLRDRNRRPWLKLTLPSGRAIFYCEPELREDMYGPLPTHMGINSKNRKWQRLKLIPGRITENVVQAICRDILAFAKINLMKAGYDLLLSVHDEVIILVPDESITDDTIEQISNVMCVSPSWAVGLPIGAEGEISDRYKKI